MDFLTWFPLIIRIINIIPTIQSILQSGGNVTDTLKRLMPEILPLLEEIGRKFFPAITDPAKAAQAGVDVVFDMGGTKWVQNSLNSVNKNNAIVVDGVYGKATKEAVSAYQKAEGLTVDGWCGPATSASLAGKLAKLAA